MQSPKCPTGEELRLFAAGELSAEKTPGVSAHVESCKECRSAVESLGGFRGSSDASLTSPASTADDQEDAAPESMEESADLGTIGQYRLLAKLGEGGMGAVYKAIHTRLRKTVALKVLPISRLDDNDAVARFEREMVAVGKYNHPNIVGATDAGEADGMYYLAMELVEGIDLSELVEQRGSLRIADACEIIRQAAVGLEHSHGQGMVHRDIKPANLMLCHSKFLGPQVKILDMGLALLNEQHSTKERVLTLSGQMMGTLDYMPPEQGMDSHDVDTRADIYSLGATLFKLLCGEPPFSGAKYSTPVAMIGALATEQAPSIATRRDDLPEELVATVDRMLAREPDDRFLSADEVVQALVPFTQGCDLASLLKGESRWASNAELDKSTINSPMGAKSGHVDTAMGIDSPPQYEEGSAVEPDDKARVDNEKAYHNVEAEPSELDASLSEVTTTEREILQLRQGGLATSEISKKLNCSRFTVRRVLARFGSTLTQRRGASNESA